jgi:hypothetical protein
MSMKMVVVDVEGCDPIVEELYVAIERNNEGTEHIVCCGEHGENTCMSNSKAIANGAMLERVKEVAEERRGSGSLFFLRKFVKTGEDTEVEP